MPLYAAAGWFFWNLRNLPATVEVRRVEIVPAGEESSRLRVTLMLFAFQRVNRDPRETARRDERRPKRGADERRWWEPECRDLRVRLMLLAVAAACGPGAAPGGPQSRPGARRRVPARPEAQPHSDRRPRRTLPESPRRRRWT